MITVTWLAQSHPVPHHHLPSLHSGPSSPSHPLLKTRIEHTGLSLCLQLFTLFLVHACGARTWRRPKAGSQHVHTPAAEAAYQPPGDAPELYMDGPWRLQWPCLIPWALMQAAHSVAWLYNIQGTPCPLCIQTPGAAVLLLMRCCCCSSAPALLLLICCCCWRMMTSCF